MSEGLSLELLAKQIEQLQKQNNELAEQNKQLSEAFSVKNSVAMDEAPKATIPDEPVEVGGKKYKFTLPIFSVDGKTYRAEEAAIDQDLLKKLAKDGGMGVLKAVK